MQKTTRSWTAALALALLVTLTLVASPGAEAATYPRNKCFIGFLDANAIPGLPYTFVVLELFQFRQDSLCFVGLGKCGPFNITGTPTATRTEWTGAVNNEQNFLFGGDWEISAAMAERRYPGGTIAGVMYVRDQFFVPTLRYNGTIEGAQVPCP